MSVEQTKQMPMRMLGSLQVSAIGYGCMGLSHGYGAIPERDVALRLIREAYQNGCTFFDTAEVYGYGHNEDLVGEAVKSFRDKVVIATKLFFKPEEVPLATDRHQILKIVQKHLDDSLKRLQMTHVELYYLHRIPATLPLDEFAYAMAEIIKSGKVKAWGMSQATSDQIRLAHSICPLSAIENEYSIMERMYEPELRTCAELGIGFVPFSPLASGFLSGKYNAQTEYKGDDVRRVITRFDKENVAANQPLLDLLRTFAERKHATLAQISLAWMLHKDKCVVPIPGMRTTERIVENFGAADVILSDEEFKQLDEEISKIPIHGNRTDADIAKLGTIREIDTK